MVARVNRGAEGADQRLLDERVAQRFLVRLPDRRLPAFNGGLGAFPPGAAVERLHPVEVAARLAGAQPVRGEEVMAAAVVEDHDPGSPFRGLVDRPVERVVVADVVDGEVVLRETVKQRWLVVKLERA